MLGCTVSPTFSTKVAKSMPFGHIVCESYGPYGPTLLGASPLGPHVMGALPPCPLLAQDLKIFISKSCSSKSLGYKQVGLWPTVLCVDLVQVSCSFKWSDSETNASMLDSLGPQAPQLSIACSQAYT